MTVAGGVTSNAFGLILGGGANVKVNDRFALQLIPAEYVLNTPNTFALNSYGAQVGVVYSFGSR